MGCGGSKFEAKTYNMDEKAFSRLCLVADSCGINAKIVNQFWTVFSTIDMDKSGSISKGEFFAYFDILETEFSSQVFTVMDRDYSGHIDFAEFVASIFNYCAYGWKDLVRYAFELVDHDESGVLEMEEVKKLVAYVYGGNLDQKVQSILRMVDEDGSGAVDLEEFMKYNRSYPVLLFPAFHMQVRIGWLDLTVDSSHTVTRNSSDAKSSVKHIGIAEKLGDSFIRAVYPRSLTSLCMAGATSTTPIGELCSRNCTLWRNNKRRGT